MIRTFQLSVAIIVAAALFAYPGSQAQEKEPQANAEIRKLMMDRRDILQSVLELQEERVHGAEQNTPQLLSALLTAHNDLLEAELDLAANKRDRIQLLEALVKQARAFEEEVRDRNESGITILRATAHRIQAEVRLLKASE